MSRRFGPVECLVLAAPRVFLLASLFLGALTVAGCTEQRGRRALTKPSDTRTVLLLDFTDPLPPEQMRVLQVRLCTLARTDLATGEKCSLWILGGHGGVLHRVFEGCAPPMTGSPLISNKRLLLARADSLFIDPLLATVARENATARASHSPIVQAIGELAVVGELPGDKARVRLFLVSDLRQRGRVQAAWEKPNRRLLRSTNRTAQALSEVDVVVLFVPRPGASLDDDLSLQSLWRSHLLAEGAASVRVERL